MKAAHTLARALPLFFALGACSIQSRPANVVPDALMRAATLHREAEAHAARGDIEAAVRALRGAADAVPSWCEEAPDVRTDAYAEIARLWTLRGDGARGEEAARQAIAHSPRASFFGGLAWLRLGDALKQQGRAREAVTAFERSIAINAETQERILALRRAPRESR